MEGDRARVATPGECGRNEENGKGTKGGGSGGSDLKEDVKQI